MLVPVGSKVRSYDFPSLSPDCYVEGIVKHVENGVATIFVTRDIWEGKDMVCDYSRVGEEVRASLLPGVFGPSGVVPLEEGA